MASTQQKKWIFTLNELDNEELPQSEELQEFLNKHMKTGVFGLEKAPTTGRNHYQGRFELQSKRIGKRELLDTLKEMYPKEGWTVSPEWQTKESIDYCKKGGEFWYLGDSAPYTLPDLDITLYPWQETMISIAKTKFHQETERLVWYLQDTDGGIGKSKFTKWLCVKETELNGYLLPDGSIKQMMASVCSRVNKMKKPPAVVIYDKTRTVDSDLNEGATWQAIERIKTGYISDPMFGSGDTASWSPPAVFVFSNFDPNPEKLSLDRWVFVGVDKKNQLFIDSSQTSKNTLDIVERRFNSIPTKSMYQRRLEEVYNTDNL
jgi:hypothetical protein